MTSSNGPLVPGRIVLVQLATNQPELVAIVSRVDDPKEGVITAHYFHPNHSGAHAASGLKPRFYVSDLGWRWPTADLEEAEPLEQLPQDDPEDDEENSEEP